MSAIPCEQPADPLVAAGVARGAAVVGDDAERFDDRLRMACSRDWHHPAAWGQAGSDNGAAMACRP